MDLDMADLETQRLEDCYVDLPYHHQPQTQLILIQTQPTNRPRPVGRPKSLTATRTGPTTMIISPRKPQQPPPQKQQQHHKQPTPQKQQQFKQPPPQQHKQPSPQQHYKQPSPQQHHKQPPPQQHKQHQQQMVMTLMSPPKSTSMPVQRQPSPPKTPVPVVDFRRSWADARDHPLLRRYSESRDPPFRLGELVWAKETGTIYWPGFITTIENETIPGESPLLKPLNSICVLYIEPRFRVQIVNIFNLIRVSTVYTQLAQQKDLILFLNKVEGKKKPFNAKLFSQSLQLLDDFWKLDPANRHQFAISCYAETFGKERRKKELREHARAVAREALMPTPKRPKLELNLEERAPLFTPNSELAKRTGPPDPNVIVINAIYPTPSRSKSPPKSRRKSSYGLRETVKLSQRFDSASTHAAPQYLTKGASGMGMAGPSGGSGNFPFPTGTVVVLNKGPGSISDGSDSGNSLISTNTNNSSDVNRRNLSGEGLKQWVMDVFHEMDKSYKFDQEPSPLRCAECREVFGNDGEIAYCHDYPFHKKCMEVIPIRKVKKKDAASAVTVVVTTPAPTSDDPDSDPNGGGGGGSSSGTGSSDSDPTTSKVLALPSQSTNELQSILKCKDCAGQRCFICKKDNEDPKQLPAKCSRCDLRFHRDCLGFKWPMSEVVGSKYTITCPLHFCHVCKAEHKYCGKIRNYKLNANKAVRCLYCLASYHKGSCVPAGCGQSMMPNNFIICPRHYGKDSRNKAQKKQKLFGCTLCSKKLTKSDKTIACTICPLMFHFSCIHGNETFSDETIKTLVKTFECESCVVGNFPLYGQVVWFQQPGSSYWPAVILYPRESAHREAKGVGMFSVRYCGYPTQYFDQGRSYQAVPFQIGTKDFLKRINLFDNPKVISASEEAFHLMKLSEMTREAALPPPEPIYRKIEKNLFRETLASLSVSRGGTRGRPGKKSLPVKEDHEDCDCAVKVKEGDVCTYGSGCYNRAVAVECNEKNCKGGDRCRNRMFSTKTDQIEDSLEWFISSTSKGWGLRTTKDLKAGTFVIEYVGEIISKEEVAWRVQRKLAEDPLYFLEIDTNTFIDAEYYGNLSRLINHSCVPNCRTYKYHSAYGKPVIGIFASRDVEAGEELTFDYNYGPETKFAFKCRCKNEGCKGYIGRARGDKENQNPGVSESSADLQPNSDWKWEDECARCGMRGELLMCDFPGCSKAYHHQCINLASTPKGNWYCPEHPTQRKKAIPVRRTKTVA